MKNFIIILIISAAPLLHCHSGDNSEIDKQYISNFDVNRYLGTWYEIARYPHAFEKNLQGVKAKYTMKDNNKIQVTNSGYEGSVTGPLKTAEGKARMAGNSDEGHLEVSFFLWFYADYLIMELDTANYQYALVGSSSDKYLWILARSPYIADTTIQMLYNNAAERGYDTTKLERIKHKELPKFDPLKAI